MQVFARIRQGEGSAWVAQKEDRWELIQGAPWNKGKRSGYFLYEPLKFLAPVIPGKIIAIGSNYRDHAKEMNKPVPEWPKIFFKPPSSVIGPTDPILIPPKTTRVDHEAELGVVIGKRAFRVPKEEAAEVIFGYTVVNDVTARDFQAADGVFARAKGFDSFCPVGPYLVSGIDVESLSILARVDGKVRQNGNTADMVFGVPELIEFISNIMTLEPGDLISTGTPAGVGPLVAGQSVEIEIPGIGILKNPVLDRDDR
jgi:2-keto-4-pentenoate hydratase/2-oxohepta-3-ene-1,7-dioic acid hydratase in catechol pathway